MFDMIRASSSGAPQAQPTSAASKAAAVKTPIIERVKKEEKVAPSQTRPAIVRKAQEVKPTITAKAPARQPSQSLTGKPIVTKPSESQQSAIGNTVGTNGSMLLSDKYRPKTMKQIVGQHGDRSCANKLHQWLRNWHKNRRQGEAGVAVLN